MFYLENSKVKISILDPGSAQDKERLGPRFCTGNYIYQVEKKGAGPLLSGPHYPNPAPPVSDGQGLPEVFQPTIPDDIQNDEPLTIIGVGRVAYNRSIQIMRKKERVISFCSWKIKATDHSIGMVTHQQLGSRSLQLSRKAQLDKNVLKLTTTIQNTCDQSIAFSWFAHPFYQIPKDRICGAFHFSSNMANNPGFSLSESRQIRMKQEHNWEKGHFHLLETPEGETFKAQIYHPVSSDIIMKGNFPLTSVALWANARTFSIEPFYKKSILPSEQISWELTYAF